MLVSSSLWAVGRLVCLDPGHGGKDPGAVGPRGLREADVVLDIALRLAKQIKDAGGGVLLTRDDDRHLTLQCRSKIANASGAEVFVSLHANSWGTSSAHGTETYHFPGSVKGKHLAQCIQQCLVKALGLRNRGIKDSRSYHVLRATSMPAVLAEPAFISHPDEEAMLASASVRQSIAEAIAQGLRFYFLE